MKVHNYNEVSLLINYPDDWGVEEGKNIVSVYDPINGVGVLQFSFYQIPDPENVVLKDELEDYLRGRHNTFSIMENKNIVYSDYVDEDQKKYWRYWLFVKNSYLVFASYNCLAADIGKEDGVVNEIVRYAVEDMRDS